MELTTRHTLQITLSQRFGDYYPQWKTSVQSLLNVPGKIGWATMEIPALLLLLYTMFTLPQQNELQSPLPWVNWAMAGLYVCAYLRISPSQASTSNIHRITTNEQAASVYTTSTAPSSLLCISIRLFLRSTSQCGSAPFCFRLSIPSPSEDGSPGMAPRQRTNGKGGHFTSYLGLLYGPSASLATFTTTKSSMRSVVPLQGTRKDKPHQVI